MLLNIQKLNRFFGGLHAVNDISFSVRQGIIKAVIGPNGAGKTTLFNLITGNLKPDSGDIFFKDHRITPLKEHRIAALGISRTFQTTKLFSHMTVCRNVMVGRHIRTKAGFISSILNLPFTWKEEKEIRLKSLEILRSLELADCEDEDAHNLSFGKQRLVEIARALAAEPELLLLDEPAAGLNIHETEKLAEIILQIKNRGITILLVEHDISLVMGISDEVFVLDRGKMLAEGKPEDIQKNRDVINTYLGEGDA
ncbi:MAG: ABC transporter ATP-binding protein [Spirochaetales bacterium]|nr:ABC transporter ATP-binding protein [Spirochaetales bacterium]